MKNDERCRCGATRNPDMSCPVCDAGSIARETRCAAATSYENAPATKLLATYCACCARPLVDAVSVETGVGPDCRRTHGFKEAQQEPNWDQVGLHLQGTALSGESLLAGGVEAAEAAWRLGGLETRRIANVLVHHIAAKQTGKDALGFTNAVRALGFTKLADRISARLARVHIEQRGDALLVRAAFCPHAVSVLRAVPGRYWHRAENATIFPAKAKRALFAALCQAYPGAVAVGPKGLFVLAA